MLIRSHAFGGALALTALVAPTAAYAAPAPTETSVQRIYSFDGTGDAVLLVSGSIDPGKGRGLFATVSGYASNTEPTPNSVFFPHVIDLDGTSPHTYGALGQRDLCDDPVTVCSALRGGGLMFSTSYTVTSNGEHPWHVRFAVVARGAKVTFKDKMIGWRPRNLRGLHQITDDAAQGAGVSASGATAGATLFASAPATRGGSVAIATPPCESGGAGLAVLSGPAVTGQGVCPTDAFTAAASQSGTWTLTGPAAGLSSRSTRLLVLDF
jgi:hypothetical protein